MNATIYDHQEVFESYVKNASEKDEFIARFKKRFGRPSYPVSMLDLGCNDGSLAARYLESLMVPPGSHATFVDPNAAAIEIFRLRKLPDHLSLGFLTSTAEDFCVANTETFDWIVASHSLYWSPSLPDLIVRIIDMAKNAIIVIREPDGLYTIEDKFKHLVQKPSNLMYSSDDVEGALKKCGVSFQKESIRTSIPVPARATPEFRRLVSFFLDTPPDLLSDAILRDVENYLEDFNGIFPYSVAFFLDRRKMRRN